MLPAGLADKSALDEATKRWWRGRDRDAYAMHWFATDIGAPGPSTPVLTAVLRGIADDAHARHTLMRVLNHEVAPKHLVAPRRLAIAAGRAVRRRPRHIASTGREVAAAVRNEIHRRRSARARPAGMDIR